MQADLLHILVEVLVYLIKTVTGVRSPPPLFDTSSSGSAAPRGETRARAPVM